MRQNLMDSFMRQSRELIELKSVLEILTWDQETMMPSRAAPFRARQYSALSVVYHQKLTSRDLGETLERLSTEGEGTHYRRSAADALFGSARRPGPGRTLERL